MTEEQNCMLAIDVLSMENFSPFGTVIKLPGNGNETFSADHFQYWKRQGVLKISGDTEVGVLQVKKHEMLIRQMEKHDRTEELLVPLTGDMVLSVATGTAQSPKSAEVKAFRVARGEAVLLNKSCWHWMPCPTDEEATILVIFKDDTSATDLIISDLDRPCFITAPST